MIQSNAPLSNVESNLSADEIAVLLGYANAAAMAAATEAGELTTPALTGGTSTAYTLTDTRIGTPVDGQVFALRVHAVCGASPTLAVNGGAAIGFARICADGVNRVLGAGQLQAASVVIVRYYSADVAYQVVAGLVLSAADIPSTLNATTFAGNINMSSGGAVSRTTDVSLSALCGGTTDAQANGAFLRAYGNSHATKPGDAEYYTGTASSAAHSFFDKNGAEQLTVNEYGPVHGQSHGFFGVNGHGGLQNYLSNSYSINIYGGLASGGFAGSAGSSYRGSNDATYPGAHQQFAPLSTRAASTAFAVCPVATGDTARVELQDDAAGTTNCVANVDSAGTVTFLTGSDAKYVNSSSPGAAEIGVYISAGVLYAKPGSGLTVKIASFSRIGKA